MKKLTKVLCTGLLCTLCLCPGTVNAANVSNDTVIANENVKKDSNMNENKACQDINSKWNALSEKQKKDIYKSYKCKLDAEFKLVDKLCKYGMISEEDATKIKEDMMDNYKARKENKEFPLQRGESKKEDKRDDKRNVRKEEKRDDRKDDRRDEKRDERKEEDKDDGKGTQTSTTVDPSAPDSSVPTAEPTQDGTKDTQKK